MYASAQVVDFVGAVLYLGREVCGEALQHQVVGPGRSPDDEEGDAVSGSVMDLSDMWEPIAVNDKTCGEASRVASADCQGVPVGCSENFVVIAVVCQLL